MKQTCNVCKSIIEIDEARYKPGEVVETACPCCESIIAFSIPQKKENTVTKENKPKTIILKEANNDKQSQKQIATLEAEMAELKRMQANVNRPKSSSHKGLITTIIALLIIAVAVGGYYYYTTIYLPEKIDNEAERYYTFADDVVLRSSTTSGASYNKIATLPYGTELITYEHGDEWSKVKVNVLNAQGEKMEGYVKSPYILSKPDFFLLNSIFGDTDSKQTVLTSKCRNALLTYFKTQGYMGNLSSEALTEGGIDLMPSIDNQWQVFSRPATMKPNSVFFKRLIKKDSKFTDFAVIITNINIKIRRLLFFTFDDDETPHLVVEQHAPETGYIKNIYIEDDGDKRYLRVQYSD